MRRQVTNLVMWFICVLAGTQMASGAHFHVRAEAEPCVVCATGVDARRRRVGGTQIERAFGKGPPSLAHQVERQASIALAPCGAAPEPAPLERTDFAPYEPDLSSAPLGGAPTRAPPQS
jgi:hypothetical protein